MSEIPLYQAIAELPEDNMTVKMLNLVNRILDEDWQNITGLEEMIRDVTGEEDEDYIQEIGEYAIELYEDPEESYQTAMKLYHVVDSIDKVAGAAAIANQAADRFSFLEFAQDITPSDEKVQALDAGVKFCVEMVAFNRLNGFPGDTVGEFATSLMHYGGDELIRIGTWVAADCVLPLGPDFAEKIYEYISGASTDFLTDNRLFQTVSQYIPGSVHDQKNLIVENIESSKDWLVEFAAEKGLTQERVSSGVSTFVTVGNESLDYLAAAIDVGTNYYAHTGTQSVTRNLVDRAYGEC